MTRPAAVTIVLSEKERFELEARVRRPLLRALAGRIDPSSNSRPRSPPNQNPKCRAQAVPLDQIRR
jgi:hypothetical protein